MKENQLFTINEMAEKSGVHPQTLRNWEKSGLINPIQKFGNHRLFTEKHLEEIKKIQELKNYGYQIKGIKKILGGKQNYNLPLIKERDVRKQKNTDIYEKEENIIPKQKAVAISAEGQNLKEKKKQQKKDYEYYDNLSIDDLTELARNNNVKYFRQMLKNELVESLAYPENAYKMAQQAKERTKTRYGGKVYGKNKDLLSAAQKIEVNDQEVSSKTDLIEDNDNRTTIEKIIKWHEEGKTIDEISSLLD